jgi:hypothetical protein
MSARRHLKYYLKVIGLYIKFRMGVAHEAVSIWDSNAAFPKMKKHSNKRFERRFMTVVLRASRSC